MAALSVEITEIFANVLGILCAYNRSVFMVYMHLPPNAVSYYQELLSMFNQQEYINDFIKENYKTLKIRIRKDNKLLMNKISTVGNVNKYISSLILEDIYRNRSYNYINNDIEIDFELSKTMQSLVDEAEKADILDDYGLYMNIAAAIDSQGKKETTHHQLRESEWKKLTKRYKY